ncbi:uncharacterized protein LOC123526610 [Mercenaria mercenaria]|uniref:uncharacterized protein LOC123526610 n=1 Tax=Mercenaria mercenaria TaxID=6596 RepID=UPI00234E8A1D|nr:uncharacterized protein LOC123526610 [Mercenaria mercenaria]
MLEEVVMHNETKNGEHLFENAKDFPAIIVITCMLSCFSVVGTTGNAFVLYVFSRKKDKNTSTIFILALASIDFVTCLFLIPFTIVVEFMYKRINSDVMCKVYQFFITSHVPFSAFIMVAIAFDRYFCICRPWMKFLDIRFAKRIIMSLLAFSLTLGLITSLAYGVYHRKPTVYKNITSEQANNSSQAIGSEFNSSITLQIDNLQGTQNCSSGNKGTVIKYKKCQFSEVAGNNEYLNTTFSETDFVFTGFCYPNEIILSKEFRRVYQTVYASLFLIAFITVFILYALIYRSILVRRSKKLQSSLTYKYSNGKKSALFTCMFPRQEHVPEQIQMTTPNTNLNNQQKESKMTGSDSSLEPMSTATCQTSTLGHCNMENQIETEQIIRKESSKSLTFNNKNLSNEIIKEESENSSSADGATSKIKITPNNLNLPETDNKKTRKRRKRNRRFLKSLGKKDDNTKNINKRIVVTDVENGTVAQKENFKVTTYNICRKDTRKSVREKHRLANIKTAGILFIVTIVFIIAFLPAWLMATKLIPPNMIVFYTYFIYNVANPVIYAFFNQAFQQEMKTVLKCSVNEH